MATFICYEQKKYISKKYFANPCTILAILLYNLNTWVEILFYIETINCLLETTSTNPLMGDNPLTTNSICINYVERFAISLKITPITKQRAVQRITHASRSHRNSKRIPPFLQLLNKHVFSCFNLYYNIKNRATFWLRNIYTNAYVFIWRCYRQICTHSHII